VAIAVAPALLLLAVHRWADGRAAAAADGVPAGPPPPAPDPQPALGTALLSFRRTAGRMSRDLNLAALTEALQPMLAMVGDRSCAAVSLDGHDAGARNPGTVVIPA